MPLELHRAKLDVGPEQSVASIAYDSCYGRVAIARERGTVEIREGEGLWRLCAIIPGDDNASTTSVEWIRSASGEHPLLVTAGLEGTLATWDIRSGSPADIVDSYGGAIWAIVGEKNPRNAQRLAVACDDGAVRQYEVSGSGGLVLRRVMPRATCRQLSVDWLEAPSRVVAGGSDSCVRIYDADSAQEALRVTLGGESVCAWAVAAVTDRLFAVGDSEGRLSVYDSHQGTLEHRERRHAADVLAVAAVQSTTGKGGKRIFSGGADGMIAVYDATESEQPGLIEGAPAVRQDRWAYSACKRPHSHDVYALCCALQSDAVFSGGLDGSVMACSASGYLEFHPWDVIRQGDPTMFSSSILDQDRALLSCPWGRRVHLYRAGKAGDPVAKDGKRDGARLNISEPVGHEASIRLPTRAHARCAALSPGGQLVAASDRHGTRVVELKSRRVAMRSPPARNVALCGASDAFLVAVDANDDSLRVTSIRRGQESALLSEHVRRATSDAVSTAANRNPSQMPLVRELACSADGRYAAVSMQSGPIAVFVYDLRKLELHWAFPCPTTNKGDAYAAISTLTFTLDGLMLAVATEDNQVLLLDVRNRKRSEWSERNSTRLPQRLLEMPGRIRQVSFDPSQEQRVAIASSALAFCCIDFARAAEDGVNDGEKPLGKRKRGPSKPTGPQPTAAGANMRMIPLHSPCLFMSYVAEGRAFLVERSWEAAFMRKPAPIYRHRYGA